MNDEQRVRALAGQAAAADGGKAYRALFDDAAAITDYQRRYQARRVLAEHALRGSQPRAVLKAAADGLVGALAENPAEPLLLQSLQALATELGERPLTATVAELRRQLRPLEGLQISLCMIVKDEAEMLPRSLAAAAAAVDEIVVVDTGSTDGTVEIAESFGAKIVQFPWTGSFAQARNKALEHARGDWVFFPDADEVLQAGHALLIRELAGETWHEAYYFSLTNHTGNDERSYSVRQSPLRMFRNRPGYRYEGAVHERLAGTLPTYLPERFSQVRPHLDHYGYTDARRAQKQKATRNAALLTAELEQQPDDYRLLYHLGSEREALGDLSAARASFERAWSLAAAAPANPRGVVPMLAIRYITVLGKLGAGTQASQVAAAALERYPALTDVVYQHAIAVLECGDRAEGERLLRAAIEMGDAPPQYTALIGAGTFLPRLALAKLYASEAEFGSAIELLGGALEGDGKRLAIPLLELLIEALIATKQFALMERSVVLWEQTALPADERRRRLDAIYRRHGLSVDER